MSKDKKQHQVHSGYLTIPRRFQKKTDDEVIYKRSIYNKSGDKKFESDRAEYIKSKINYNKKTVLDIGCNTGYFLYEALDQGASKVTGYEGCIESCQILNNFIDKKDGFELIEKYYSFEKNKDKYDVIHLLNVLHHIGRDFAFNENDLERDKIHDFILSKIDGLANNGEYLVFQIGYNQKGDVSKPLFENGTKIEQIDLLKNGLRNWDVLNIGIPIRDGKFIKYVDLNNINIERDDSLGEFLNRPLFILKRKDLN